MLGSFKLGNNENPYNTVDNSGSSIFNGDGTEKLHYHFGVFYLGGYGQVHKMYRANLIDFHNLGESGPKCETLNLSFEIPYLISFSESNNNEE